MTAVAVALTERQRWHREQLARFSMVRGFVGELVVMSAAMFSNWVQSGALRPHGIDGRERFAKRTPRGAWELLQWVAAVCARQQRLAGGGRRNFNALQVPWPLLAQACGCSPEQLSRSALPWLIERELVHREYFYQGVTKRKRGYRRDSSTGSSNQGPCVLMLGVAGEALLRHRRAAAAASRARAALMRAQARAELAADRKKYDPRTSVLSYERTDPLAEQPPVQSARARVGDETPASPAPSVVQVEALRRRFPPELRPHLRPLADGVDGQTRRRKRRSKNEPDGHEGPGVTDGGGGVETQRQRAPAAAEAAQAPPEVSGASQTSEAVAEIPAPSRDETTTAAAVSSPGAVDEYSYVKGLLAGFYEKAGGDRPPEVAAPPPIRGSQGALPGRAVGELMRATHRRAKEITEAAAALFGEQRPPEERAENERRRKEALDRARREAGDDSDDGGGGA